MPFYLVACLVCFLDDWVLLCAIFRENKASVEDEKKITFEKSLTGGAHGMSLVVADGNHFDP